MIKFHTCVLSFLIFLFSESDKVKYDTAISHAATHLSNTQLQLLKLSLSLHIYSPRIEMYSQMATQRNLPCPITVDVCGEMFCALNDVISAIESNTVKIIE